MDVEIALGCFYSQGDERRFFEGLNEIEAIKSVNGVGVNLIVSIEMRLLNKEALRELMALLWRYGIPLAPLYQLAERKKYAWLNDERGYWHQSLFDIKTRARSRVYSSKLDTNTETVKPNL